MENQKEIVYKQYYSGTKSRVYVEDQPGSGGGCHEYSVTSYQMVGGDTFSAPVKFQKGHAKEVGVNGIQNEHLIAMVIHRLQGFQSGPYSCRENELALTKLQEAMMWLEERTKDRTDRGVDGENEK